MAGDSDFPQIADVTAPFVYVRIMGTSDERGERLSQGAPRRLGRRTRKSLAAGPRAGRARDRRRPKAKKGARDVFLYVISGFKERNPAAAMAIIDRL